MKYPYCDHDSAQCPICSKCLECCQLNREFTNKLTEAQIEALPTSMVLAIDRYAFEHLADMAPAKAITERILLQRYEQRYEACL